jgi:uncharacterized protein YjeT (DUF2065 family)
MTTEEFLTALALMMIFEGLAPVLFPRRWQSVMRQLAGQETAAIRRLGLVSLILGLVTLILVRQSG